MSALTALGTVLVLAVTLVGCAATDTVPAETACKGSLQALVRAAAPGDTVKARGGCVYREAIFMDKPLTLKAGPGGTEIRGSEIWGDAAWSRRGSTWVSSKSVPKFATDRNLKCETNTKRCRWPEQVFIDGRQLTQVAVGTTPGAGQFALGDKRTVILGNSPIARTVEVTERSHWVRGLSGGANVTINGFTMKHAASDGVDNNWNDNWTVKNGDFSYSHTSNLMLKQATGLLALDNKIHHGGQKGVTGNQVDLTLQGNKIYNNNTEDFKSSWSAGGVKIANPKTVTFDGNRIYNNRGSGLWLDVPTENQVLVVKNNRVHHNTGDGIRSEVTNNAQIFSNVVWENGFGNPNSGEAGILLNASSRNHVHDNVVAWNENGILVRNPERSDIDPEQTAYDYVSEVEVDHNDILQADPGPDEHFALGWELVWLGGNIYETAANNRGHDNRYWYPAPEGSKARYRWTVAHASLDAFNNDTRGEEGGRYLSDVEKDDLAATNHIPSSPPDTTAPTTKAAP